MSRWEPDAKGRLVVAAIDLFSERGYDQTTVSDIAERARVTERTFYRHFSDKREVLFAGADLFERQVAEGVAAAPADLTPLRAVTSAFITAAPFFDGRRSFALKRSTLLAATPSLQERELLKLTKLSEVLAGALLERGTQEGDARLAAGAGVAVFRAAFATWVAETSSPRPLAEHIRQAAGTLRILALG